MRQSLVARIALVALLASAGSAGAQVVAHPNQIVGTYRLTNTNPVVLAAIDLNGLHSLEVSANSADGSELTAVSAGVIVDRRTATYEITVESGTPGIPYDVRLSPRFVNATSRSRSALSAPVEPEPAPDVVVNAEDCLGIITTRLVDLVGDPVIGSSARVNGRLPPAGSNEIQWLASDGVSVSFWVTITTGTDPLSDLLHFLHSAGSAIARCDEVVTVDCVIDPNPCDGEDGIVPLGRIVGNVDVLGAELVPAGTPNAYSSSASTLVTASDGPFNNRRHDVLNAPDRLRGAYELENLLASSVTPTPQRYVVTADAKLDVDGVIQSLAVGSAYVTVGQDETVDLGDALVVDPSDVRAGILVAGPPPSPARGRAMLQDAWMSAGIHGTRAVPPGARSGSLTTSAGLDVADETYDDASASLTATWRMLTGGMYREPSVQDAYTYFSVSHVDDPTVPNDWYSGSFGFEVPENSGLLLLPGDRHDLDVRACVGQVLIGFRSTDAPFYDPHITSYGRQEGVDFEGNLVDRRVWGRGGGLPAEPAGASMRGSVKLVLPEGDYVLTPTATFVNPGGGVSGAELLSVPLHVGCRQVLTGSPTIFAQMTEAPSCAGTLPVRIAGSVNADEEIASLTWSVDAGAPVDACRPCGFSPAYDVLVPPSGAAQMEILVTAVDVLGREATVTHYARFSQEPSAVDLDASQQPLLGSKDAGNARFSWSAAGGISYSLYRGSIASLHAGVYDHAAFGACGLVAPEWTGDLGPGSWYLLATAACGFGDAPLGRDSFGREIPGAGPRCP